MDVMRVGSQFLYVRVPSAIHLPRMNTEIAIIGARETGQCVMVSGWICDGFVFDLMVGAGHHS